jgi:hypothetical protein
MIYHKFPVYSKFNIKNGNVISKYINCNNCGITHQVYELCRSKIVVGKEETNAVRSINDISLNIDTKIIKILNEYACQVDVYEEIEDILENKIFPSSVIIKREVIDENNIVKVLTINEKDYYKITSEVINTTML